MSIANVLNEASELIVRAGVGAVIGGVAAAVTAPVLGVTVLTGAVFCGSLAVISKIVEETLGRLFHLDGTSHLTHAIGNVVTVLVGVGIAALTATILGFPIGLVSGLAILGIILLADVVAKFACKVVKEVGNWIIGHANNNEYQRL